MGGHRIKKWWYGLLLSIYLKNSKVLFYLEVVAFIIFIILEFSFISWLLNVVWEKL